MAMLGVLTIVLLAWVACVALWIWSLVDALRFADREWAAAGQTKVLWVVLIVFLGLIGSLLYVRLARPALAAVRTAATLG
jgi:hypothetical protein